ncbi:MAG TPA: glycosyltransferase [Bacteroidia bacterium]|jgi:glycosyltransferase involved in cell wall biosynthesis|nr:glycosyltransferase [Bacteroidia bacterium]
MEKPNTLHLFTMSYPNGNSESFVENEVNYLALKFKKIYIYPSTGDSVQRNIPSNVTVMNLDSDKIKVSALKVMLKNIGLVINVHFKELIHSSKKITYIKHLREFNSRLLKGIVIADKINTMSVNNDIFYSFWMNENALALAVLKYRKKIDHFVFRANGFDLYDVQAKYQYIPFRPFIFKQADKMFAVAKKGSDYMKSFNVCPEKITYSYFGTNDLGVSVFNPNEKFTIFTCSDLRKIKRVDAMVDILSFIKFPVKWIHHGNKGDNEKVFYEKLKQLSSNVEFILHERKENYGDVLQFFKQNHFNLFVLLSSIEGLPVSLIEAMSFGIPLLATDVGGVSEVINENNGILIECDFKPNQVAEKITQFLQSEKNTPTFRKKVRTDWENRFSATKNYENFYLNLINYELS